MKKLSQFVKNFSFISSFYGKILDKSYNLKNFYNSVFLAFESKSLCTNLKKYTNRHKKFYLSHSVVYFTKFFCIITAINLFLKSTVKLCVIFTVLLFVIFVFNTIFDNFDYFLVFFLLNVIITNPYNLVDFTLCLFLLTFTCLFLAFV